MIIIVDDIVMIILIIVEICYVDYSVMWILLVSCGLKCHMDYSVMNIMVGYRVSC